MEGSYLGVDYGTKRIGFALGMESFGIVTPLKTEFSTGSLDKDAENILKVAKYHQCKAIVIGVPVREGQGPSSDSDADIHPAKLMLNALEGRDMPVFFTNESLSSKQAETRMWEIGIKSSKRKKKLDAHAACIILERFFEEHKRG